MDNEKKEKINRLQERISAGDGYARDELLPLLTQAGLAFCCAAGLPEKEREDCCQNVIIHFFLKGLLEKSHSNFYGLFRTATYNAIRSYFRAARRHQTVDFSNFAVEEGSVEQQDQMIFAMAVDRARSHSPHDELIHKELIEDLKSALEQLPGKASMIYRLHYFDGLKQHEIAEQLGVAAGTVADILSTRWRDKNLRPALERMGWDDELVGELFNELPTMMRAVSKKRQVTGVRRDEGVIKQ